MSSRRRSRERKARETRRRILDAAERLFVRDGYASTTIVAIAEDGDVAVQTVYAVFGTKRAILTELLATRTAGEEEATPLRERADWKAMENETDPLDGSSPSSPPSRRRLAVAWPTSTR